MAVDLLRKKSTPQEAVCSLVAQCGVSPRQAYRYVQQAQGTSGSLPLPESKVVFTVKLPISLIDQVRQSARGQGRPISELVSTALREFLSKPRGHG